VPISWSAQRLYKSNARQGKQEVRAYC